MTLPYRVLILSTPDLVSGRYSKVLPSARLRHSEPGTN